MTGDHLGLSVSVTKKRVSKGVLPKGTTISPDSIKTRHKTKPANFYLYKCSHCLCSQACTCSCKNKVCLCNSHLCGNYVFPFRVRRGLNKKKKECKLSLIMTFISKCYLYKCAHCLGSQACTCSCKSQECWYSLHLCDSHGFHPCIHQFLEEVENIKLQRKHNYLRKNVVKAWVANYTITNAPISCVARPARAVI